MTRPPTERRVALLGFQGFGNVGDEAILAGIESLLEGSRAHIALLIGGPQVSDTSMRGRVRRLAPRRLLPDITSLRELRRSDALILAGGGLFNDHWAGVIPRYLAWVLAARLAGARVVWVGVGVGPIRRRAWRVLARIAARLSHRVLVRDEPSAELLGGTSARIAVVPDPALFLPRPESATTPRTLAIVVRPPVGGVGVADALVGALDDLLAAARREGVATELVMLAPAVDAPLAGTLAAAHGLRVVALGPDPLAALQQLARYDSVVSVRLHGLLLAAVAGVPCLPIAYDDKVAHASAQLDIADLAVDLASVGGEDLWRRLQRVAEPARRRRTAEAVDRLRARRSDVTRLIEEAL